MMVRTFVAVGLPEGVRSAIADQSRRWEATLPNARWVRAENLHITMAFLGDVAEAAVPGLIGAVGEAVGGALPFSLEVRGLGAFPSLRRPRVLWVGIVGEGLSRLIALREAVVGACAGVGLPTDEAFHPHVTLARFRAGKVEVVSAVVTKQEGWSGGVFGVSEVVVYASELSASGPRYRMLGGCPLGAW